MLNLWTDFMSKLMAAGTSFSPDATPPEAAREIRAAVLQAWAEFWDRSMRTPEFLQGMQQSMAGAIEFRKQISDLLGQVQHELQSASRQDMDQLMRALRRVEQRVTDGMERLEDRFGELHKRLDDLERRVASANGEPNGVSQDNDDAASGQPPRRPPRKRPRQ